MRELNGCRNWNLMRNEGKSLFHRRSDAHVSDTMTCVDSDEEGDRYDEDGTLKPECSQLRKTTAWADSVLQVSSFVDTTKLDKELEGQEQRKAGCNVG